MITILISICLIADHTDCRDKRIQLAMEGLTPHKCVMRAQEKIADPKDPVLREGEYVARYTCKPASVIATRI